MWFDVAHISFGSFEYSKMCRCGWSRSKWTHHTQSESISRTKSNQTLLWLSKQIDSSSLCFFIWSLIFNEFAIKTGSSSVKASVSMIMAIQKMTENAINDYCCDRRSFRVRLTNDLWPPFVVEYVSTMAGSYVFTFGVVDSSTLFRFDVPLFRNVMLLLHSLCLPFIRSGSRSSRSKIDEFSLRICFYDAVWTR